MKVVFPTIESRFHTALRLDNEFHSLLSGYLEKTNRDFIGIRSNLFITCDSYKKDGLTFKICIIKIAKEKPTIISMGNVILFAKSGFTILPEQAFNTLFEVKK